MDDSNFKGPSEKKMRKLKIRRSSEVHNVNGLGCHSLEHCISKGCEKLKIDKDTEFRRITLLDGTVVDDEDYFDLLESDTLIIFETNTDPKCSIESMLSILEEIRMDKRTYDRLIARADREFREKRSLLVSLAENLSGNIEAETFDEDPDWFKGLSKTHAKTKSRIMESSAMNRVRSYLREAKEALEKAKLKKEHKQLGDEIYERWHAQLQKRSMFRSYFSRTQREDYTLCDEVGWFSCEGDYLSDECGSKHVINPYRSKGDRAMFSQWNLDHKIEKARTVLPKVIELIRLKPAQASRVNWDYFFELMFTRRNLKHVHIACHIKQKHTEAKIDDKSVFV